MFLFFFFVFVPQGSCISLSCNIPSQNPSMSNMATAKKQTKKTPRKFIDFLLDSLLFLPPFLAQLSNTGRKRYRKFEESGLFEYLLNLVCIPGFFVHIFPLRILKLGICWCVDVPGHKCFSALVLICMSMSASHTHADRGQGELLSSVQHLVNSQPDPMAPNRPSVSDRMLQSGFR